MGDRLAKTSRREFLNGATSVILAELGFTRIANSKKIQRPGRCWLTSARTALRKVRRAPSVTAKATLI